MSNGAPLRLTCRTEAEIPHPESLDELVVRGRHLVLQFPAGAGGACPLADKSRLIRQIAARLPEDIRVFDSGPGQGNVSAITLLRVVPRAEVLRHEEELVEAARLFRRQARDRVEALAAQLKIDPSRLWAGRLRAEVSETGRMPEGWSYGFHGMQCRFTHQPSGQVLDVELGYEREFGVLDPYFFARFVRTTAGLDTVARLFQDEYHDPQRAFDILEERGRLVRVSRSLYHGSGLLAPG